MKQVVTRKITSEAAMQALGANIAAQCQGGELITLQGELGAGKTTLVRGFMRQLGHKGAVKSPTYALVESYQYAFPVNHFDLYRLTDIEALEMIGFQDYLAQQGVCLIEWPECYPALLDNADIRIVIDYAMDNSDVDFIDGDDSGSGEGRTVTVTYANGLVYLKL